MHQTEWLQSVMNTARCRRGDSGKMVASKATGRIPGNVVLMGTLLPHAVCNLHGTLLQTPDLNVIGSFENYMS